MPNLHDILCSIKVRPKYVQESKNQAKYEVNIINSEFSNTIADLKEKRKITSSSATIKEKTMISRNLQE